jgi:hypothetical protein
LHAVRGGADAGYSRIVLDIFSIRNTVAFMDCAEGRMAWDVPGTLDRHEQEHEKTGIEQTVHIATKLH